MDWSWNPRKWRAWLDEALAKARQQAAKATFRSAKPQVEQLEERRLPSLVAVGDFATTPVDTPVTMAVLSNDTITGGSTVTAISVTTPWNGTATVVGSSVVYTPNDDFFGSDSFNTPSRSIRQFLDGDRVGLIPNRKAVTGSGVRQVEDSRLATLAVQRSMPPASRWRRRWERRHQSGSRYRRAAGYAVTGSHTYNC